MIRKGDIVDISGVVETTYDPVEPWTIIHAPRAGQNKKYLVRRALTWRQRCLVVGVTYRATGCRVSDDDGNYLAEDMRHSLLVVEPMAEGDRYLQPYLCTWRDVTLVRGFQRTGASRLEPEQRRLTPISIQRSLRGL